MTKDTIQYCEAESDMSQEQQVKTSLHEMCNDEVCTSPSSEDSISSTESVRNQLGHDCKVSVVVEASPDCMNQPRFPVTDVSSNSDEHSSVSSFEDISPSDGEKTSETKAPDKKIASGGDSSSKSDEGFTTLRVTYLLVTLVIMLSDGLQGTENGCTA